MPGKPRPPLLTGGILAAAALVAASAVFSWFIGLSSRYSLVYGSLASVVILLVWLYFCGNLLLLGVAVLNLGLFLWRLWDNPVLTLASGGTLLALVAYTLTDKTTYKKVKEHFGYKDNA